MMPAYFNTLLYIKDAYLQQVYGSKYHILGDAAYPLEENIITPFKDYGNLTMGNYSIKIMPRQEL